MTTLARLTIGLLAALILSSCVLDINLGEGKKGNGIVIEDQREVSGEFTVITASEGLDVYVTQADDFRITVEADENIASLIGTDIVDGKLKVHAIKNIGRATKKVHVSLPYLTALQSSSGAHLRSTARIKADKISLDASSGSDLEVELVADEIEADTSSGADLDISGEANVLRADASSGADIKARELLVKECFANASSGADISVHVSEALTADASSGAAISYTGDASVQQHKSVSGSVHKY